MNSEDRELGMGRAISRRNFVQGVAVAVGGGAAATAAAGSAQAAAAAVAGAASPETYPPLRTGMRGAHPGAFEAAHAMRDGAKFPAPDSTGEVYDLVVVGCGISGLAAANFFRKRAGPKARILILDNHDDFGGHAKRNEFLVNGRQLIASGGSGYMVAPTTWSREAIGLIDDLGIDWRRPHYGGRGLQTSLKLGPAAFFRKAVYGEDRLVVGGRLLQPAPEFLARTPLSEQVKADTLRLVNGKIDYLSGMSTEQKIAKLKAITYRDYLLNIVKVHPDVLAFTEGVWCLGLDTSSAWFAYFRYKPGFDGLGVPRPEGSPESPEHEAVDFRLPAGNSDIARLMVRALIPQALAGGSFADVETLPANYAVLDDPLSSTRIRLSSIVVRAKHLGPDPPEFQPEEREVEITYVRGGKLSSVRGKNVVMAGMNNVVPYLCPEMPKTQKVALHAAVRAVNQSTNVLFRNWDAFAKLQVNAVTCPNNFFGRMSISAPQLLGAMTPIREPSEPVVVAFATGANSGILSNPTMVSELTNGAPPPVDTDMDNQFRLVRAGLLQTPFSHFERAVRRTASGALAGGGLDPARDILAITVNRWPHGFATGRNTLFDKTGPDDQSPTIAAKQKFGRITICNSDASGVGTVQTAIDEAWRAVSELEPRDYGYYETF